MVSHCDEPPNWVKANDPFFAMFPNNCINRAVWLLTTLPTEAPTTKEGKPISVLEFFLSMDEENFWSVMDCCPECTGYVLFNAFHRRLLRKFRQLANMDYHEHELGIDMLFESGLSSNRKLLRGKCVDITPLK